MPYNHSSVFTIHLTILIISLEPSISASPFDHHPPSIPCSSISFPKAAKIVILPFRKRPITSTSQVSKPPNPDLHFFPDFHTLTNLAFFCCWSFKVAIPSSQSREPPFQTVSHLTPKKGQGCHACVTCIWIRIDREYPVAVAVPIGGQG